MNESIRDQRYLMGCVLVEARSRPRVRSATAALSRAGRRLHFNQELDSTRRAVLEALAVLPLRVHVVVCAREEGVREFNARAACLTEIVRTLQSRSVARLTIESRHDDRADQRTIGRVRQALPTMVFEHRDARREPVLWVADAVTWAFGAGGGWLVLASSLVDDVTEVRP